MPAKAPNSGAQPLTGPALRDFGSIIKISDRDFGHEAAARYRNLIETAIREIVAEPKRPGSRTHASHIRTYHIGLCKDRVAGPKVRNPRHILVYQPLEDGVEILRILHDSRILSRALPAKYRPR